MGRDRAWLAAAAMIVVGAALRAGPMYEFWLNGDEGLYYYIAHAPYELARVPMAHNAHPPGYFWLLRGAAWLGDDFLWLRIPSFLAGIATIYVLFRLGEELGGRVAGVTAASLVALSPGAIAMSQVARQYAILALLLAVGLRGFLRFLRTGSRRELAIYSVCLLVACTVQYGSFVLPTAVAAVTLGLLVTHRIERRRAASIAVAQLPVLAAAGLLYAFQIQPNLVGGPMQREAVHGWLSSSFATAPGGVLASFVALFEYLAGPRLGIATAALFGVGLVVCVSKRRGDVVGVVVAALAIAAGLSLAGLYPFGGTRHSFHLAPLVALPMAMAVAWVVDRGVAVALLAAAVFAAGVAATGPIGAWPGLFGARTPAAPELRVPRREIADLKPVLSQLYHRPGVTVTDLETIYMLSPVLRAADAWPRWFGSPSMAVYPYGRQRVVVAPVWHVSGGLEVRRSPRQLAGVLRTIAALLPDAAALLADGVTVISTDGGRLLRTIPTPGEGGLGGAPLVQEIARSPHVSVFRLDVARYRAAPGGRFGGQRRQPVRRERPAD